MILTTTPTVVEMDVRVGMRVIGELRHRCPFADETDLGTVTIDWTTDGATLELHSLADYLLFGFADVTISHEELTEWIRSDLSAIPGISEVRVSSNWGTAGMKIAVRSEVPCGISPTPPPNLSVTP